MSIAFCLFAAASCQGEALAGLAPLHANASLAMGHARGGAPGFPGRRMERDPTHWGPPVFSRSSLVVAAVRRTGRQPAASVSRLRRVVCVGLCAIAALILAAWSRIGARVSPLRRKRARRAAARALLHADWFWRRLACLCSLIPTFACHAAGADISGPWRLAKLGLLAIEFALLPVAALLIVTGQAMPRQGRGRRRGLLPPSADQLAGFLLVRCWPLFVGALRRRHEPATDRDAVRVPLGWLLQQVSGLGAWLPVTNLAAWFDGAVTLEAGPGPDGPASERRVVTVAYEGPHGGAWKAQVYAPGFSPPPLPGTTLRLLHALRHELTVVAYGSHGDHAPMAATVGRFQAVGVRARLAAPISQARGTADLHALERGDVGPALRSIARLEVSITALMDAGASRLLLPASYMGPQRGHWVVSPEPPRDCAKPVQLGVPFFDALGGATFGANRSLDRIGEGLFALPRVHANGSYYRRHIRLGRARHAVGIATGSSGSSHDEAISRHPGAPDVPAGDHTLLFRDYDHIVCHGGVGTMATAIASGATAESVSNLLDRRWVAGAHERLSLHGSDVYLVGALFLACPEDMEEPYLSETDGAVFALAYVHAWLGAIYVLLVLTWRCLESLIRMHAEWTTRMAAALRVIAVLTGRPNEVWASAGGLAPAGWDYCSRTLRGQMLRRVALLSDGQLDGHLAERVAWVIAADCGPDGDRSVSLPSMGEIALGAMYAFRDDAPARLCLTRLVPGLPFFHSSIRVGGMEYDLTQEGGETRCRAYAASGPPDLELGLVVTKRHMDAWAARRAGHDGRYGLGSNCLAASLDALCSVERPTTNWPAITVLCALLCSASGPLGAIDLLRSVPIGGTEGLADWLLANVRLSGRPLPREPAALAAAEDAASDAEEAAEAGDAGLAEMLACVDGTDARDVWESLVPLLRESGGLHPPRPPWVRRPPTIHRGNWRNVRAGLSHRTFPQQTFADIVYCIDSSVCLYSGGLVNHSDCALCATWRARHAAMPPSWLKRFLMHINLDFNAIGPEVSVSQYFSGLGHVFDQRYFLCLQDASGAEMSKLEAGPRFGEAIRLSIRPDRGGTRSATESEPTMPRLAAPAMVPASLASVVTTPYDAGGGAPLDVQACLKAWARDLRPHLLEGAEGFALRVNAVLISLIEAVVAWLAPFRETLEGPFILPFTPRLKAAWAVQPGKLEQDIPLFRLTSVLARAVEFVDLYGDAAFERLMKRLNELAPEGQLPLMRPKPSRRAHLPAETEYSRGRAYRALTEMDAQLGRNCVAFASEANVTKSLNRYLARSGRPSEEIDDAAAAAAMLNVMPELYENHRLVDPAFVARQIVMKYSCGLPFEGNAAALRDGRRIVLRRRRDLRWSGWLNSVVTLVRDELSRGIVHAGVHHAFVKNYITTLAKLEADGGAIRTVVAQSLDAYIRDMVFAYSLNKRASRMYETTPFALGMTLSGGGYNDMLASLPPRKFWFDFDFVALDANVPDAAIEVIKRVRAHGFRDRADADSVRAHIDANYEALKRGTILDLIHGNLIPKRRGTSTGQASVSADNHIAVHAIWLHLYVMTHPGATYEDATRDLTLKFMADDGLAGTDEEFTADGVKAYVDAAAAMGLGLKITKFVEGPSPVGLSFCRKRILPRPAFAKEFIEHGIRSPEFVIVHDAETILMRQTAVAHKTTPSFYWNRTIGHMLLCAHNEGVYDFLRRELELIRPALGKSGAGQRLMAMVKPPSYKRVLQLHYKKAALKGWQKPPDDVWQKFLMFDTGVTGAMLRVSGFLRRLSSKFLAAERVNLGSAHVFNAPLGTLGRAIAAVDPPVRTRAEFRMRVSAGPASGCIDVDRHWNDFGAWSHRLKGLDPSGVIMLFELVCAFLMAGHSTIRQVPGLRMLVRLYELCFFDGTHIYGLLSGPYYAATASSSAFLSTFVPRDPWVLHKRIACWLVDLAALAPGVTQVLGPVTRAIAAGVNELSMVGAPTAFFDDGATIGSNEARSERWEAFYDAHIRHSVGRGTIAVEAQTGTGKTRDLVGVFAQHWKRVFVTQPRRNLVEQLGTMYHIMERGSGPLERGVITCTAGHFAARRTGGGLALDPTPGADVILVDEAHDRDATTAALIESIAGFPNVVLLSATLANDARFEKLKPIRTFKAAFARPFPIEIKERHGHTPNEVIQEALTMGMTRILVVAPKVQDCQAIATLAVGLGVTASVYHRGAPVLQPTRVIAATQIVDSGINIPGVDCVIDTCRMLVKHKGVIAIVPVDAKTAEQRAGRTGRFCPGTVFRLGPVIDTEIITYPSFDLYAEDPALWGRVCHINCPLGVVEGIKGASIYAVDAPVACGWNAHQAAVVGRFVLRHDSADDAFEEVRSLQADHDLHADLFSKEPAVRRSLIEEPERLRRFLESSPFRVRRDGHMLHVPWLALRDGSVVHDSARHRPLDVRNAKAFVAFADAELPMSFGLPSAAAWAPPSATMKPRRLLQVWTDSFDVRGMEAAIGQVMSDVPTTTFVDSAILRNNVRNAVERIAGFLEVFIFLSFDATEPAILCNRTAPRGGVYAMLHISSSSCRAAYWSRANLVRPVVFGTVPHAPAGSMSAAIEDTIDPWETTPANWTGLHNGSSANVAAQHFLESGHIVDRGGPRCGRRAIHHALGLNDPADGPLEEEIPSLREYARQLGAGLVVIIIGAGETFWDGPAPGAWRRPMVVLRLHANHYTLVVMPLGDNVRGLLPLAFHESWWRAELMEVEGCEVGDGPLRHGNYYVAKDATALTAGPWMSEHDWYHWGNEYVPYPHWFDEVNGEHWNGWDRWMVGMWRRWASHHRTLVTVIWNGIARTLFPDLGKPAHAHARMGRKIVVEFGANRRARLFYADGGDDSRGSLAWSDVKLAPVRPLQGIGLVRTPHGQDVTPSHGYVTARPSVAFRPQAKWKRPRLDCYRVLATIDDAFCSPGVHAALERYDRAWRGKLDAGPPSWCENISDIEGLSGPRKMRLYHTAKWLIVHADDIEKPGRLLRFIRGMTGLEAASASIVWSAWLAKRDVMRGRRVARDIRTGSASSDAGSTLSLSNEEAAELPERRRSRMTTRALTGTEVPIGLTHFARFDDVRELDAWFDNSRAWWTQAGSSAGYAYLRFKYTGVAPSEGVTAPASGLPATADLSRWRASGFIVNQCLHDSWARGYTFTRGEEVLLKARLRTWATAQRNK